MIRPAQRPVAAGKRQRPYLPILGLFSLSYCAGSGRYIPPPASLVFPGGFMKLMAKATAALALPAGKTEYISRWDDETLPRFGFRLAHGRWRQGAARRGRCSTVTPVPGRGLPLGRFRARRRAARTMAMKACWTASPAARTRRPTRLVAATRTSIRSGPSSPIILAMKKRELRASTSATCRASRQPIILGPLLALRSINHPPDVAARLVASAAAQQYRGRACAYHVVGASTARRSGRLMRAIRLSAR